VNPYAHRRSMRRLLDDSRNKFFINTKLTRMRSDIFSPGRDRMENFRQTTWN
jgi:hypothetical protein